MLNIGIIGYGRIGRFHAENLTHHVSGARVIAVVDPKLDTSDVSLTAVEHVSTEVDSIFDCAGLDAIVIASPVQTHIPLIHKAIDHKLAVFCEKPLGIDMAEMQACCERAEQAGTFVQIGFNRRFDPHFKALKQRIDAGELGDVHTIKITSFDPDLPPLEYLKQSGGIFFDMTIHDFDMVRYLANSEVESIQVLGDALCEPSLRDIPDIDSAVITMKLSNDVLAMIINSRRASYGYDQRIEVHGSKGMLSAENVLNDQVNRLDAQGEHAAPVKHFFIERYQQSYINELTDFVDAVLAKQPSPVDMQDGIKAIEIAQRAATAYKEVA